MLKNDKKNFVPSAFMPKEIINIMGLIMVQTFLSSNKNNVTSLKLSLKNLSRKLHCYALFSMYYVYWLG